MLSPISILPPLTVSMGFYSRKEKYGTRFKNIVYLFIYLFFKLLKPEIV